MVEALVLDHEARSLGTVRGMPPEASERWPWPSFPFVPLLY
jgi:hypothetical protein